MKIIQFRKAKYQGFGRLEDNHVIPFLSDKNPFNSDLSEEEQNNLIFGIIKKKIESYN